MKQQFEKLEDGRIKWFIQKDNAPFTDNDFGNLGETYHLGEGVIFDNYENAMSVLDRDYSKAQELAEAHKQKMDTNEHNLDTFTEVKDLVEAVGKLHNDFKEIKNTPDKLYADNPKKYQKLLREFNTAKDYIKDEMSNINKEYGKFLEYKNAKKAYDFTKEQIDKIDEQRQELMKLQ